MTTSGDCTPSDGKSMVEYGDLPTKTLAIACSSYFESGRPRKLEAADIRINKADHTWTNKGNAVGCSGLYDLQAVMTHEWGHTFGLDHVSEYRFPSLTMSTQIGPCDVSARTLGRGDVLGLRARY